VIGAYEDLGMEVVGTDYEFGHNDDYQRTAQHYVKDGTLIYDDVTGYEFEKFAEKIQPDLVGSGIKEKYVLQKMGIPFRQMHSWDYSGPYHGYDGFAIYEIGPEGHKFLEAIQFDGDLKEDGNEDKLAPKIEAVKDCAILYVAAIGGSGAARVVANNIHPMKVNQPEDITDLLAKLEDVLKGTPPPWLRKALSKGKEKSLDFED
jgi:nitrogen fixation protein NifX